MNDKSFFDSEDEDFDKVTIGTKFCKCNGTCGHTMDEFTTLKALMK